MVKMLFFLKRRPDLSAAEFHRYWSERHGPLFANSAAARRYVVRYEQHHAAPENGDVGGLEFDGFSVMWFRGLEDLQAMRADPDYRDLVVRDGDNFLDMTAAKVLLTHEPEQFTIAEVENGAQ
jgi:uncharacterized protein (TIGR02118 family)